GHVRGRRDAHRPAARRTREPRRRGRDHGAPARGRGGDPPVSVPILEVMDLHAAYGRIEVLRGVDLTLPRGAVVALLGPNGAGKSTLLKVVSGQMRPTGGDIHMAG